MAAAYIIDPPIPRCTLPHNGGSRPRDRYRTILSVKLLAIVQSAGDERRLLAHVVRQELVRYLTRGSDGFLRRDLSRNRLIHFG